MTLHMMLDDPTEDLNVCIACQDRETTGLICPECEDRADTDADLRYERAQDWSGDE